MLTIEPTVNARMSPPGRCRSYPGSTGHSAIRHCVFRPSCGQAVVHIAPPESPQVPDLAAQGFVARGCRVDVVGHDPVATIVYKHAAHTVS